MQANNSFKPTPLRGASYIRRYTANTRLSSVLVFGTPLAYSAICASLNRRSSLRSVRGRLDDQQYRALQLALALRPEQGALAPGRSGLRKLRWGAQGRGKRGGIRTVYYWAVDDDVCYMLYVYAKNEQGDLTPAQIRALARVVREEFK